MAKENKKRIPLAKVVFSCLIQKRNFNRLKNIYLLASKTKVDGIFFRVPELKEFCFGDHNINKKDRKKIKEAQFNEKEIKELNDIFIDIRKSDSQRKLLLQKPTIFKEYIKYFKNLNGEKILFKDKLCKVPFNSLVIDESKGKKVDTRHYYKDIINYIDIGCYKKILYSGIGDLLFAAILFPEKKEFIKEVTLKKVKGNFNFEKTILNIKKFLKDILDDIEWKKYHLIGFTTTHQQIVPSLLLSKLIKKRCPKVRIVFGGMLLVGKVAKEIIEIFSYVDYIIMGEGEKPLLNLVDHLENGTSISRIKSIVYRDNNNTHVNIKKGGKCTFCVENTDWRKNYRKKTIKKVVKEIIYQIKKYQTVEVLFCDPSVADKIDVFKEISKIPLDLKISAEVTSFISKSGLKALKDAGVSNIQIGIESFSDRLIKVYNKGTGLMKMVEILKWCKELGINLSYNIIIDSPFETKKDIIEIRKNINYLRFFQPPFVSKFVVSYESQMYYELSKYKINRIYPPYEVSKCYPQKIAINLTPLISFHGGYSFKPKNKINYKDIILKIKEWKAEYPSSSLICFRGENFLDIESNINGEIDHIIIEGRLEKEIYLICMDASKSINEILNKIKCKKKKLLEILNRFIKLKIMFYSNGRYLSLAMPTK
ncbi:MAG: radical SAM protein [Candidatus Pacearchaeota archaeon]|nr:radical SAM protein [Candidatus Pacearchaeota archaeon]